MRHHTAVVSLIGCTAGLGSFVDSYNLTAHVPSIERDEIIQWTAVEHTERVKGVEPGSELQLGSIHIKFIHTPGHSPGGTSLVVSRGAKELMVLTGDTLFPGINHSSSSYN